jgi:hypothetical protein
MRSLSALLFVGFACAIIPNVDAQEKSNSSAPKSSADSGVTVSPGGVASKKVSKKEADETRKYWTPERLRNAKPMPMPSVDANSLPKQENPTGGSMQEGSAGASGGSPGAVDGSPPTAHTHKANRSAKRKRVSAQSSAKVPKQNQ